MTQRMVECTYTRSKVSNQELKSKLSLARKSARQFGNELQDAGLARDFSDVPCKKCAKPLLEENSALVKECSRLETHSQKVESLTRSTECCCIVSEKIEDVKENCTMDLTFVKKCMSNIRKIIRQYNDDLDDAEHAHQDRRLCGACKDSIHRECQGLVKELQNIDSLFVEGSLKDICHCQYCSVSMREGAGRRKNKDGSDSGFVSVDSTMIREATESLDPNSTPDTTEAKVLSDTPKLAENDKGPCVSLYGRGSSSDENDSTDA